jgi:signal transduction histidine kinase
LRLVANLLDNAIHHNVPGGWVEVTTRIQGGEAHRSISNSGPPIPADQIERLFEPFQRIAAERTGSPDGHHGLGLSIVRAIASAHDATITARPGREGGLAVEVAFPGGAADGRAIQPYPGLKPQLVR